MESKTNRVIVGELFPEFLTSEIQIITASRAIASQMRRLMGSELKVAHYSLESLTQNMVRRRGLGIATALLSRRLLQHAVRETIATKDIEGTAKAYLTTIRDLFRSGSDLKLLAQNEDPRVQQLAQLAIAYQDQLRSRNRIDPGELYWQGSLEVAYQKPYLFYGYFAPRNDELGVINAIAGDNSILVLPGGDWYPANQQAIAWLQEHGWQSSQEKPRAETIELGEQLQQSFLGRSALPDSVGLQVFADLAAEVRGVLTQVKILLSQGVEPQDIVLVTQDEQLYGATLIDLAWEYNLPIELDYEIPLEQTRLGGWLKLLLEVIRDDFPFEATAKLLAHPLAQYLTEAQWSSARQSHPQGIQGWQQLGIDLSLVNFEQASYPRAVWLQRLQAILVDWDILEKGKGWARETVAYYRFLEIIRELSQPEGQILTKAQFTHEIKEILALLTIPAQPGMGGIGLHHPSSIWGTSYPYVLVLGSVEGILPLAIADDPILDFWSRKQLVKQGFAMETAVDLAQREQFNFFCLLAIPNQQITFTYAEVRDRQPQLPSSYLTRLGLQPTPTAELPLASVESARRVYLQQPQLLDSQSISSLSLPQITHAWQVEITRESASPANEYDGVIGVKIAPETKIFSASQLTQFGQCPFKWFSARLLKLKALTEAESDLSAALRGNLYHRCLELSLATIKTASDLAQFNQEQLAQAFAIAEQELNLEQLPGWSTQRQEHLDLLALNLSAAEFLPPEREVVATETKFEIQWYDLQVQGQVDRIDRTPTGLAVIDYKTSGTIPAGVKDATGKANIDLQLAVYQDAIAQTYPDTAIDTAVYYSLTKQKTIARPQKDPAALAQFAQSLKTHLETGSYPVSPDLEHKACRYCDYDLVCRQGDRLRRK